MATIAERYDKLLKWVEDAGGGLHPSVEIYHDEVTRGSFRVKESCSLGPDDVIVTLPLSRSLSFLNITSSHLNLTPASKSGDEPCFPSEFLTVTPPHVVGRFVLMREYLLERGSKWWPYIRTLPQPEHIASALPLTWPSEDVEFLRGTNAAVAIEELKSALKKEYKRAMKLLPEKMQYGYTKPLYYWAYCIFTSRSFRPSLIIPAADAPSLPCAIDDFSVLLPLFDIGNHSPTTRARWATDEDALVCKLKSGRGYSAGEQVFNNYGLKTNAELLLGYGFVVPETEDFHNDYIHVKTRANPHVGDLAASHIISLKPLTDPSSIIGRSRQLNPDLETCLPCFSHVQDSLVAALYEAMSPGNDGDVDLSLTDIMQGNVPKPLLDELINSLGSKLSMDLELLEGNDPEYEPSNRNQQLALYYRQQCKRVLGNTLLSLSSIST